MTIDYRYLKAREFRPVRQSYSARDTILVDQERRVEDEAGQVYATPTFCSARNHARAEIAKLPAPEEVL